jgi:non-specific serine/threonine protein kinase
MLDGIPLAIELATARLGALTLNQLAARLDDALRLLVSGSWTALPRHKTLRGTLEWSYRLLPAREKQLFDRLAVFAGGWTLEAAEVVCTADGLEPSDVLDTLTHLIDKSLVVALSSSPTPHYRLLETLRQFGRKNLLEGGELARLNDRHAEYFLDMVERSEPESWGPAFVGWWARLEAELGNIRAALRWLIDSKQVERAQRLGGALARFWKTANYFREGTLWFNELLALSDAACTPARAKLLMGAGDVFVHVGNYIPAEPLLREALAVSRELRDDAALSFALFYLSQCLYWHGRPDEARKLAEEGAAVSHAAGLRTQEALCLQVLEDIHYREGHYVTARSVAERALALDTADGYARGIAIKLMHLGWISYAVGDLASAQALLESSLQKFREGVWPIGICFCQNSLGWIATDRADVRRARACFDESVSIAVSRGFENMLRGALEGFA